MPPSRIFSHESSTEVPRKRTPRFLPNWLAAERPSKLERRLSHCLEFAKFSSVAKLGRGLSGSEPGIDVLPRAFDSQDFDQNADLRQQFYQWLVAPENPYFARCFANRVWANYFGIGLVDPVDDFSVTNPPSHPRLLDELAECFRESNFDIRDLEKTNSDVGDLPAISEPERIQPRRSTNVRETTRATSAGRSCT